MKLKLFVIFIALAAIFNCCECVVDNDTEKIITPTEFANILFINAVSDDELANILVYSASKILDKIDTINNQWDITEGKYKKVGIKVSNQKNILRLVSLNDTTRILFNSVVDLKKDSNYTFVAFGINKYIQSIFMSDYIEAYNPDNVYFRFFNAIPDSPELFVKVETEGYLNEFLIKAAQSTRIYTLPNGEYNISIINRDSSFKVQYPEIIFQQGKMNNFVLKGKYKTKSIKFGIVSVEI